MTRDERVPIPIASGVTAGIVAWLVGYAVTLVVAPAVIRDVLGDLGVAVIGEVAADWELAGWVFYNAHGVDVPFPGAEFVAADGNFVAATGGALTALYLVPVGTLIVAGAAVAWRFRGAYRRTTDAAIAGATVVVGYLLSTVLGLVVFAVSIEGVVLRPDPLVGVVLAGLAMPIAFGAVGGIAVLLLSSSES